jgi:hypothetical protein
LKLFGRKSNSDSQNTVGANSSSSSQPDAPALDPATTTQPIAPEKSPASAAVISPARLEKSRRELKTLLFEKGLVSSALTRLYEAEASGEITKDERETLAKKYREQLKDLDGRVVKVDAFIEVGDLEVLREQLIQLVHQKVEAIERRIERTRPLAESLLAEEAPAPKKAPAKEKAQTETQPKPRVPDISNLLQSEPKPSPVLEPSAPAQVIETTSDNKEITAPSSDTSEEPPKRKRTDKAADSGDDEVDNLQQELRDALDRLEKLDLET